MTVPVAAVYKNYGAPPAENQVRAPRHRSLIQPKTEACLVKVPPDLHLWLGIAPSDARHHSGTHRWSNNVCHDSSDLSTCHRERPFRAESIGEESESVTTTCLLCLVGASTHKVIDRGHI
jgi:hypothetical protein